MQGPTIEIRKDPRPTVCLRHHVWMAACRDCRDARSDARSAARPTTRGQ